MASLLQLVALTTLWHVPAPTEARAAPPPAELEHQRWAAAAFQLTISLNCSAGVLTSPARCELLQLVERRRSVVYLAERPAGASLVTVLPDGQLSAPADADAVLVIDPFPEAAWGHLVSVFTVQRHHVGPKCGPFGGIKLGRQQRPSDGQRRRSRRHGTGPCPKRHRFPSPAAPGSSA
ncbi:hypothetical protein FJT64_001693 [Amphibalanus amphitrite]|uniref:Nicastrin n=1 Tax=Amphibalanus amphitrite TaxID=1232801 RepID=A0A6A4X131_AMPAM|nr:hypothetical protein FJT64_001693 [Amphibalanus amphitrite]